MLNYMYLTVSLNRPFDIVLYTAVEIVCSKDSSPIKHAKRFIIGTDKYYGIIELVKMTYSKFRDFDVNDNRCPARIIIYLFTRQ